MNKYNLIQDIMKEKNIFTWLMYSEEKSDSVYEKYICNTTTCPVFTLITQKQIYMIVNSLDYDNVNLEGIEVINSNSLDSAMKELLYLFKTLEYPSEIYLSFSTLNDVQTDILGYGTYKYITESITENYESKEVLFKSAENIIYALYDRKTERTKDRMKIAANRAVEILEETFQQIKSGMTELEIVDLTHSISNKIKTERTLKNITKEQYSWEEEMCPIVLVGPSILKGGHALASKQKLIPGMTVYMDFGIKLIFDDGEVVSSDIQRMGYFLKNNETKAPKEIQKIFDTLVKAIDLGIDYIKPGMKGYEVDQVVRKYILDNGYPDYDHSTGHSIGEEAHNPGTLLGIKSRKQSNLEIQKYGIYTIEPRIAINNGGSIEEMIFVTDSGSIAISKRQKELVLIKE